VNLSRELNPSNKFVNFFYLGAKPLIFRPNVGVVMQQLRRSGVAMQQLRRFGVAMQQLRRFGGLMQETLRLSYAK